MSTSTQTTPKVKQYILLEHTHSTAPIYIQANQNERVRLKERPLDHAYLQTTFTDKEGKQRTIRLKLTANTIYQDEQIKLGILANEKVTMAERKAVEFRNGILLTKKPIVQEFLEASPQFEGFVGESAEGLRPLYRLYDPKQEVKSTNEDFKKRLKAGNKIEKLSLEEAQELMIKLNGGVCDVPNDLDEVQNALISFVNEADDIMLDKLLEEDSTTDEKTMILIGKLVNAGVVSFEEDPTQVSILINDKWKAVKQISSDLPPLERQRIFVEYLNSKEGKPLLAELEKRVPKKEKASKAE